MPTLFHLREIKGETLLPELIFDSKDMECLYHLNLYKHNSHRGQIIEKCFCHSISQRGPNAYSVSFTRNDMCNCTASANV